MRNKSVAGEAHDVTRLSDGGYDDTPDSEQEVPARGRGLFLGIGLSLGLTAAAFLSGFHLGGGTFSSTHNQASLFSFFSNTKTQPAEAVDLSEFWRVWNLLEEKFTSASATGTVSKIERIEGAIRGLVASYDDPYTVFLPPSEASYFEEDISGNFGGVGMEVGMRDGFITVIAPLPDTPATTAGVLPGDIVVRIDGRSTERLSIDEAVRQIRGEKGTVVVLTLAREGVSEFIEVEIVRDTITIPTVETRIEDGVFIISFYNFNAQAELKMQEALREYVKSGSRSLVLDLRGNPGGFLHSSIAIASYFLPTGKVVLREHFGGDEEVVYRSQGKLLGQFAPQAMVVLVDEGSASAAEILAGALAEHKVATLIGEQTFGKGSVQELINLPGGSSLKVTIARWLTPNGNSISDGGLTPDIVIERTAEDRQEERDPQLEAAKAFLRGELSVPVPAD